MAALQGALSADELSIRSVFVKNISYKASEAQLKKIFATIGPVLSFRLAYDRKTGKSKGYGFCEYADQKTAVRATSKLNGYKVNGRYLRVDNAASKKSKAELKNLQASLDGPIFEQRDNTDPEENSRTKILEALEVGYKSEKKNLILDESPYGPDVFPGKEPEAISKIMSNLGPDTDPEAVSRIISRMPPEQLIELFMEMQIWRTYNPNEFRNFLMNKSHLAYGLMHALVTMKVIEPDAALRGIFTPEFQPPPEGAILPTPEKSAPASVSNVLGRKGLDEELLTADVEEEYDVLNDKTFGHAANDDWEEAHEKLSELIIEKSNLSGSSIFNDSLLENDESQDEIVSKGLSQLGLEDDLDDPAIMMIARNCNSLHGHLRPFRSSSSPPPPAILETESCISRAEPVVRTRFVEEQEILYKLDRKNLILHEITADGCCLFRAVSHQLTMHNLDRMSYAELREATANYLMSHKEEYQSFLINSETNDIYNDDQYSEYCIKMKERGVWAGPVEIQALAKICKTPIEVIQAYAPDIFCGEPGDGTKLVISYHRYKFCFGAHFNSTRPKYPTEPKHTPVYKFFKESK